MGAGEDRDGGRAGRSGLSRRRFLQSAGAAGVGLGVGGAAGFVAGTAADPAPGTGTVPFHGAHQAGIVTPAQDRLAFAAFDVLSESRAELRELLRAWSDAAARLTAGRPVGPPSEPLAPPEDTGETLDLAPSRLTVTIGLGQSLFERDGEERFGLGAQRPGELRELPPLPVEALEPGRSGGDLCVQACSDDPQVAFHAVRNLGRIGRGVVALRWSQLGFGRTSTTSRTQDTPRNLMGFKDGTNNIRAEDAEDLERWVWAGDEAPEWMRGGTYMVTRRIRNLLEVWDRNSLASQEATFGRKRSSGAPLGGVEEHDVPDLAAREGGELVIPANAHIRLAAPQENDGVKLLRRGYSFTDGVDEERGQLDGGLFFIAFQRDPIAQFVRVQRRLSTDALNEYIVHTSSAVFAIPPGAAPGGYVGERLLG